MKKATTLIAVLLIISINVSAQFEIKLSAGTNFSSVKNPPSGVEVSSRAGYQFGGGLLIGNKFYVEPGIQFVRNSQSYTSDNEDVDFDQNFTKIPVYAGYHILGSKEHNIVALRVFAGPAAYIAGKVKKGEDQISESDIKNMSWMLDAGLGVDVLFLFFEANYEFGLSKIYTDSGYDSKHKGIVLNAGIHIDI